MEFIKILPLLILLAGIFAGFFIVCQPYERLDFRNGVYYKAWHIKGPGFVSWIECEIKQPLKPWVGSGIRGLEVKDTQFGKNIPELEAAAALKALGLYTDTEATLIDGEWYLFKPEKNCRCWSWFGAFHRVGPWHIDESRRQIKTVAS